jgi:hypothetical protein
MNQGKREALGKDDLDLEHGLPGGHVLVGYSSLFPESLQDTGPGPGLELGLQEKVSAISPAWCPLEVPSAVKLGGL